jgi:hypothetical protein
VLNSFADVAKLQLFLWQYEGFKDLLVSGIYDERTRAAVETFQIRYAADILIPWGLTSPTGHVYLTTQKKINELYCSRAFGISQEFALADSARQEIQLYNEALARERALRSAPTWEPVSPTVGQGGEGSVEEPGEIAGLPADGRGTGVAPIVSDTGGETGSEESGGGEEADSRRGPVDGAALIVQEIGDRFATATRRGLLGALFAGFSGPSAPTFLGILSLVLLVAGALMLIRSLRSGGGSGGATGRSSFPPPPPPPPPYYKPSSPFGGDKSGRANPSPTIVMPPPPLAPAPRDSRDSRGSSNAGAPGRAETIGRAGAPSSTAGPQPVATFLKSSAAAAQFPAPRDDRFLPGQFGAPGQYPTGQQLSASETPSFAQPPARVIPPGQSRSTPPHISPA